MDHCQPILIKRQWNDCFGTQIPLAHPSPVLEKAHTLSSQGNECRHFGKLHSLWPANETGSRFLFAVTASWGGRGVGTLRKRWTMPDPARTQEPFVEKAWLLSRKARWWVSDNGWRSPGSCMVQTSEKNLKANGAERFLGSQKLLYCSL